MLTVFVLLTFLIGVFGYLVLLVMGPVAMYGAGKGDHLLPNFFRGLAVLVCFVHLFSFYAATREYLTNNQPICELEQDNCVIAEAMGEVEGYTPTGNHVLVRFENEIGEPVERPVWRSGEDYYLPDTGEQFPVQLAFNEQEQVTYAQANFPKRPSFLEKFLLSVSTFIFLYSLFVEYIIRRQKKKLDPPMIWLNKRAS